MPSSPRPARNRPPGPPADRSEGGGTATDELPPPVERAPLRAAAARPARGAKAGASSRVGGASARREAPEPRREKPAGPPVKALALAGLLIVVAVVVMALSGGRRLAPSAHSDDDGTFGAARSSGSAPVKPRPAAEDSPRARRLREMLAWMEQNRQYQRAADGEARLRATLDGSDAFIRELDGWLAEPGFTPPSGWKHNEVVAVERDLKQLAASARVSLVAARSQKR